MLRKIKSAKRADKNKTVSRVAKSQMETLDNHFLIIDESYW